MRPLNPVQEENLQNQIDEWLEQGVINPSVSPRVSPLVPVKKKDGRTRWVMDLRVLKKKTIKNSYPLKNIQEILHSLQGATVFLLTREPRVHSIYQPHRHIPVYMNAVWISQRWECVQHDAERGHDEGGQGLLDILPG